MCVLTNLNLFNLNVIYLNNNIFLKRVSPHIEPLGRLLAPAATAGGRSGRTSRRRRWARISRAATAAPRGTGNGVRMCFRFTRHSCVIVFGCKYVCNPLPKHRYTCTLQDGCLFFFRHQLSDRIYFPHRAIWPLGVRLLGSRTPPLKRSLSPLPRGTRFFRFWSDGVRWRFGFRGWFRNPERRKWPCDRFFFTALATQDFRPQLSWQQRVAVGQVMLIYLYLYFSPPISCTHQPGFF